MKPNLLRICSLLPASFPWVFPSHGDPRSFWGADPSCPAWLCARGAAAGTPLLGLRWVGSGARAAPSSLSRGAGTGQGSVPVAIQPMQRGQAFPFPAQALLWGCAGRCSGCRLQHPQPREEIFPPEMSEPALTLPAPKMSPVLFCLL